VNATTAAEALGAGSLDFLPGELARLLAGLDAAGDRLRDVCERLAAGVDPQGRCDGRGTPERALFSGVCNCALPRHS
jgi:hypothetical protein